MLRFLHDMSSLLTSPREKIGGEAALQLQELLLVGVAPFMTETVVFA